MADNKNANGISTGVSALLYTTDIQEEELPQPQSFPFWIGTHTFGLVTASIVARAFKVQTNPA